MDSVVVNQNEVLSEANKLVSSGQWKAAIEFLLEYLLSAPGSAKVLHTLGQAYMLDAQPNLATVYLKRSLEVNQKSQVVGQLNSGYHFDFFSEEDMSFVEVEESNSQIPDFYIEDEPLLIEGGLHSIPDIDLSEDNAATIFADQAQAQNANAESPPPVIADQVEWSREILDSDSQSRENEGLVSRLDLSDWDKVDDIAKGSSTTTADRFQPIDDIETPSRQQSLQRDWKVTSFAFDFPSPETRLDRETLHAFNEDHLREGGEDLLDDLPTIDTSGDEYDDETGDTDWELLSDDVLAIYPSSIDDELDDVLDLDVFDDLDDFDDSANRKIESEEFENRISRDTRATQVAVEVLKEAGWDSDHLNLLREIFLENGWSATRRALQDAIARGLAPDELILAREIRALWQESENYWTTFYGIKANATLSQAKDKYRYMSWRESIRIIRCFEDIPAIEEIYDFIEESYDRWYNSARFRRRYEAFILFLQYRVRLRQVAGAGWFQCLNNESSSDDSNLDSKESSSGLLPVSHELQRLGVKPVSWPPPAINKFKVVGSDCEDRNLKKSGRARSRRINR